MNLIWALTAFGVIIIILGFFFRLCKQKEPYFHFTSFGVVFLVGSYLYLAMLYLVLNPIGVSVAALKYDSTPGLFLFFLTYFSSYFFKSLIFNRFSYSVHYGQDNLQFVWKKKNLTRFGWWYEIINEPISVVLKEPLENQIFESYDLTVEFNQESLEKIYAYVLKLKQYKPYSKIDYRKEIDIDICKIISTEIWPNMVPQMYRDQTTHSTAEQIGRIKVNLVSFKEDIAEELGKKFGFSVDLEISLSGKPEDLSFSVTTKKSEDAKVEEKQLQSPATV